MIFIIIIHVIVCILLIALVLIQRGRGGGLLESLSGVESVFGTKTNAFLTKSTTILSVIFFLTCLSLAILSVRMSRSLMVTVPAAKTQQAAPTVPVPNSPAAPVTAASPATPAAPPAASAAPAAPAAQ